ncbi:WS/DGAT/MGAT family O-acyltransferase [Yinghuangia sp. YIM S09857]|uniref:WS/DGAT/MGAT family O-acyltransferase n=1 Tax=Yinghuangia sp. YIM S09857 TaxID=3436929 RepID=UPI003F537DA4
MKLSGLDSAFLALESETWPMHVVCLTIVDASDTGGRVDFESFKRTLAARLPRLPLLSRRLVQRPWGLSRPHWVPDPDFDFRNHVHRATVAAPGGRAELAELATEIYRHRLDRERPLWEWWVVEGLENGRIAHLWKVHHACIDGRAGASMQEVFFDADPHGGVSREFVPLPMPDEGDGLPEGIARFAEPAKSLAGTPVRLAGQLGSTARGVVAAAMTGRLGQAMPLNMPRTRFNEPVGKARSYGFCTVSLSDVKTVKNAFGVKVNDVVLAIVGGAVRSLLDSFGESPGRQLVGTVPVDATKGGTRSSGNLITGMLVGLSTDVDDPAERLLCIHENALASKAVQGALGNDLLTGLADTPPPAVVGLGGDAYRAAKLATLLPPVCNAVISNVPGPRATLYSQGQKVEAFHSMGIIADGFGLFVGGMSYDDQIDIGVLADRDALPDPFALADSIVEQLNVLLKAAHEFDRPPGGTTRYAAAEPQPEARPEDRAAPETETEPRPEAPAAPAARTPAAPKAAVARKPGTRKTPARSTAARTAATRTATARATATTRTPAARKPAGVRGAANAPKRSADGPSMTGG